MVSKMQINQVSIAAPTPQNTPLTRAPINSSITAKPGISTIPEDPEGLDATGIANAVYDRLNALASRDSEPIASLSVEERRSLAALHGVQLKQIELQKEFKREVWELEKKYLERSKPLYDRLSEIISGSVPPTAEEIAAGEAVAAKEDENYEPLPIESTATAPIDSFWLTALRNHLGISDLITDRDAEVLRHLTDVRLSYLSDSDQLGFKLSFHFSPNEFFEDAVLEKTYLYRPEIDWSGDYTYDRAVGTDIRWKTGKDVTKEIEVTRQRNKTTNRTRLVRKLRPADSFFNFFNPPAHPSPEAIGNGEVDEEQLADLEDHLALDYQIGEDFKDRIIPHAVDYFTGKALEWDAEGFSLDDDVSDDFDDEEDSEDFQDVDGRSSPRVTSKVYSE